jgi:uncharacterized protein (DUF305 family)
MKRTFTARRAMLAGVATLVALALAAGCGNGDDSGDMNGMPGMDDNGTGSTPTSAAAFNAADVSFAQNMMPHHQQAVQMADLAATRANDAELKQLAAAIKAAQDPEIATMTGWLTGWGEPTAPAGGHSGMSMPGMMSDDEMAQLQAGSGVDFDRMFARMMIAHHNGAIQMAREQQTGGSNAEAKALAATIERTQAAEVTKLEAILDRLG